MAPASKIKAEKRIRESSRYSEEFYVSDGVLFCKSCERSYDHSRKSTLDHHLTSEMHKNSKRRKVERETSNRRQATINFGATQMRTEITHDFIAMMTESDIPLYKSNSMRPFLKKHCKNGGSIPGESTLRKYHLPKVYGEHESKLRDLVKDKKLSIAVDETTDERDESVLNIIVGEFKF